MKIDLERPEDAAAIRVVTNTAFKDMPYSAQTEAAIVEALRRSGALTISLVAKENDAIIGHAAFSPVRIDAQICQWYGLGPVSVRPEYQRRGVGSAMIHDGLGRLQAMKAQGCVVLGDPNYYRRFAFVSDPRLRYAGAPAEFFHALAFTGSVPAGEVAYDAGFAVS